MIDLDATPWHLSRAAQEQLAAAARASIRRGRNTLEITDACAGDPNGNALEIEVEITADYEEGA